MIHQGGNMKKTRIAFVLALAPAALAAQSATSTTSASTAATAKAERASVAGAAQATTVSNANADIPASYSAESRSQLNATFTAARKRDIPEQPIRDRIAEGRAKSASEAQVVLAAQRAEARLEAAQDAMVRAGRKPTHTELTRGEHAMARGATEVQIEAIAKQTPPDRSLEVALDVLTELQARGVATDRAVAQIVSKLEARASDAAIRELAVNANGNAGVNASVGAPVKTGAAVNATGAAAATTTGAGATVTGGAKVGVGGLIKPPTA
jgi:hypothetical protein